MTTQKTTAQVIFQAVDQTAAGVASVNSSLEKTAKTAKKTGEETESAFDTARVASWKFSETSSEGFNLFAQSARKGTLGSQGMAAEMASMASKAPGWGKAIAAAGVTAYAAWKGAVAVAEQSRAAQTASQRLQIDISGAREALGGYVKDMDLAKLANKGFTLGIVKTGSDFQKLAAGVRSLSEDMGEDAGQLLEDVMLGIANKSVDRLNNAGIILTQAEAEEEYATSLGKTVKELTAYEKSQAFAAVAIERISEAARDTTNANDGLAESIVHAQTTWENYQNALLGFNGSGGKVREVVRGLDDDVLKLFGSNRIEDIRRVERALMDTGVSYDQIKRALVNINDIEGLNSRDQNEKLAAQAQLRQALVDLAAEGLKYQEQQAAEAERMAKAAEAEARAQANAEAAAEMDHQVALLQAMGASEEEIIVAQTQSLELRIQHAEEANDLAAVTELQRKLELLLVGAYQKKNKARGRGVALAEKIKAAGERELQILDEQIRRMTLLGQLRGTEADTAVGLADLEYKRKLAALDLEERSLEATRAKNSVERQRRDDRLEAIGVERELLLLELQNEQREEANRLVGEAVKLSTQRTQAEAAATQRAYEVSSIRMDAEAEAIELEAQGALQAERHAFRRIEIERAKELKLVELSRKRLAEQTKAEEAALDAREAALRGESGGSPLEQAQREEELKQINHDREILRLNQQMEANRLLEAERAANFQAEQARHAATWQMVNEGLANFEAFQAQITETANFFTEYRNAAADADHQQTIRTMESRGAAQKAALQREIDAAKGNVALQNKLRKKQAKQDEQLRRQIEIAEARHQDKRKRQEMRSAGIQLMIVAAVETVKAVAAFASQNYFEGALHVAAAATAAIKGGMLLSGNIPGGGAEANLSAGGGGGAGMSAGADRETVDPSNVPGSVPGTAAARESATPRDRLAGTREPSVVINGDVNAWGEITPTVAEDLGRAIGDVSRSREL